jgi:hypothetical protein
MKQQEKYLIKHQEYNYQVGKIAQKIKTNIKSTKKLLINDGILPFKAFLTEANSPRRKYREKKERGLALQVIKLFK